MEFDDNWKDLNIIINFYQSSLVRTINAKLSYTYLWHEKLTSAGSVLGMDFYLNRYRSQLSQSLHRILYGSYLYVYD